MKNILTQSPEFWQPLLGKELYRELVADEKHLIVPKKISNQEETKAFLQGLSRQAAAPLSEDGMFIDNEVFAPFYKRIIQAYLILKPYNSIIDEALSNPLQMLKAALYQSIRDIPMRVCIYDMQLCRQNRQLQGENESAEYNFYCNNMLSDGRYVLKLCTEYFEMSRLLYTRLKNTAGYIKL